MILISVQCLRVILVAIDNFDIDVKLCYIIIVGDPEQDSSVSCVLAMVKRMLATRTMIIIISRQRIDHPQIALIVIALLVINILVVALTRATPLPLSWRLCT